MYLVTYKLLIGGYGVEKYEMLDEAKERVKELYSNRCSDVFLSKEIPIKITVNIDFE